MARPFPDPAPVTMATWSCKRHLRGVRLNNLTVCDSRPGMQTVNSLSLIPMRTAIGLLGLATALVVSPGSPRAQPAGPADGGLALLRPEARVDLERQLGVASLDELPRYEIDQAIDDVSGTLSARLTLGWTNRTGAPVGSLPLLLHPNAPAEPASRSPRSPPSPARPPPGR